MNSYSENILNYSYCYQIYHQERQLVFFDLYNDNEKRRRNAEASSRYRTRKKQREKETQEKCQLLELRIRELESANNVNAKRIFDLENELKKAVEINNSLMNKLQNNFIKVIMC